MVMGTRVADKIYCYATTNGTLIHNEVKEWLMKKKEKIHCRTKLGRNP